MLLIGTSLRSIIIPDTITTISSYAFANCNNLLSIVISNKTNLQSIGSYAFSGNTIIFIMYIVISLLTLNTTTTTTRMYFIKIVYIITKIDIIRR
jgi:hypothetical protein